MNALMGVGLGGGCSAIRHYIRAGVSDFVFFLFHLDILETASLESALTHFGVADEEMSKESKDRF